MACLGRFPAGLEQDLLSRLMIHCRNLEIINQLRTGIFIVSHDNRAVGGCTPAHHDGKAIECKTTVALGIHAVSRKN